MLTKSDENPPTAEQLEVLRLRKETSTNLMINSFAGTGKTTMLHMIEKEIEEPMLCLAFNKSIAKTMGELFKESSECRTLNSLGHRIWARASVKDRLVVDVKKNYTLFVEATEALGRRSQSEAWDSYGDVIEAVGLSKSLGYVPPGAPKHVKGLCDWDAVAARCDQEPSELVYELTNRVLEASIRLAYDGTIDFDDQIYMPALFGGAFPQFPIVMVDEVQDLSPCNHQMLVKLAKGRLIAVGDPYQSIYGFRGADYGGMARAADRFSMRETNLSISFRCPEAIVRNVHWRVPTFKWIKDGGHVEHLSELSSTDVHDSSAIICRNNAPLFRLAFHLLSSGRSVTVAGSDIGAKLVKTLKKLGDIHLSKAEVIKRIDAWLEERLAKGSSTAQDMADAMKIFTEYGTNLGQIIAAVDELFRLQGTITLTTGHKAKGLEWDTVYHLDPHLIRQDEQDLNLRYVIDTRAKERLFYINSEGIL